MSDLTDISAPGYVPRTPKSSVRKFELKKIISKSDYLMRNDTVNNPPVTLHWENLNVTTQVKRSFGCFPLKKKNSDVKDILQNINGIAKPGSALAIMGASGSGKTTLLNCLNFKNTSNLRITGDIKVNGKKINSPAELSSISGYVQQNDMFFAYFNVKEQLTFQANLKMSKETTRKEKNDRVEQILNELNLKKCENTIIGNTEKRINGISGGERRRLAFGCELITNPNILFCDEPTSGLDSFMAASVVEIMQRLAEKGKTIICTIHQPSSDTFEKFHRLCLLSEGQLCFIGNLNETNDFFASQSFPVPLNYNPADHFIKTIAIIPNEKEKTKTNINKICNSFEQSDYYKKMKTDIKIANSLPNEAFLKLNLSRKIKYRTGFFSQLKWLLWRGFLSALRNPLVTSISLVQSILIGVLLGLIFLKLNYDQNGIQNINGILFLLIANTSFSNMFAVIENYCSEVPIFIREHHNGMYMVAPYVLAKIAVDTPRFILLPFILTTIIYWLTNLNSQVDRFFICCFVIILVSNCGVAFGGLLASLAPTTNISLTIAGPILVPLMIFSGFFLNNLSTPSYFIWVKYISWWYYSNELIIINQWNGVTNITCSDDELCIADGEQIIKKLGMDKSNYTIDFVCLFLVMFAYRFVTFLILLWKSYKK